MKNLLSLFLTVMLFASCEPEGSSKQSKLYARWYNVATIQNSVTTPYEHKPCAKDYLDFNSSDVVRSYKVIECDGSQVNAVNKKSGVYTKEGRVVTIKLDGEPDWVVNVESIKDSILTISETVNGKEVIHTYTSVP
ncbi:hypothetical protein HYN59_06305 [Flavobacterium album]|uniref:Lipocalin-like domain-containing protein n=1 Tax=Flavobacterium album TaxID=2175091 RepID=A0A2S1QWH6_9FLAO|nr:lipocalin family protein [Flavobacterium album]AWH84757.1 hypothetical protein HYN59_06305 [Flavobacterium album]